MTRTSGRTGITMLETDTRSVGKSTGGLEAGPLDAALWDALAVTESMCSATPEENLRILRSLIADLEALHTEVAMELAEKAAAETEETDLAVWRDYCACAPDPDEPTRAEREQDACDARDEDETMRSLRRGDR